jgi:hypothetical protein
MTGEKDWVLQLQQGRIVGVHSRSTQMPLQHVGFSKDNAGFADAKSYAQWTFMAVAGMAGASTTGTNGSAPAMGNGPLGTVAPGTGGAVDTGSGAPATAGNGGANAAPSAGNPGSGAGDSSAGNPGNGNPPDVAAPGNSTIGDCIQNYIFPQNNCAQKPPPMGTDNASCRAAYQAEYQSCAAGFQ